MKQFWTSEHRSGFPYGDGEYPLPFGHFDTKEEADERTEAIGGQYVTKGFVIMTVEEFEKMKDPK